MSPRGGWLTALESNLGRVGGYVLAGAIAGGLGHGIVRVARLDWLMFGLRMLVGLVLVVVALRLLDRHGRLGFLARPGAGAWPLLRPLAAASAASRHRAQADRAGRALGMAALRAEHQPAGRGLAAGQRLSMAP